MHCLSTSHKKDARLIWVKLLGSENQFFILKKSNKFVFGERRSDIHVLHMVDYFL